MSCKSFEKIYDEYGRQILPTDPEDPMFSDLYCQKYITDCDRIIKVRFYGYKYINDFINVSTGRQVKPISIRIDVAYNTIDSIHNVLKEYFKYVPDGNTPEGEYPELDNLQYYFIKKEHPIIKLKPTEWLDEYTYNELLVQPL